MPEPSPAEIMTMLRQVSAQLAGLPDAIAASLRREGTRAGRTVSRNDRQTLATLLPSIWAACGGASFAVRDLLSQAAVDIGLLREIEQGFGPIAGSAKSIGKFFARLEGVDSDGLCIARVASVREGVLWRVDRV